MQNEINSLLSEILPKQVSLILKEKSKTISLYHQEKFQMFKKSKSIIVHMEKMFRHQLTFIEMLCGRVVNSYEWKLFLIAFSPYFWLLT